jgi:hypothetical protein
MESGFIGKSSKSTEVVYSGIDDRFPASAAERPKLSSRLTREKPSCRDEPLFAWPVGCSKWFGPVWFQFDSRPLLSF